MSLCNFNIFSINNTDNFSLMKNAKTKIFSIYKATKISELPESNKKTINHIVLNQFIYNFIIIKEINLEFISENKNIKDSFKNEKDSEGDKDLSNRNTKSAFGNKKEIKYENGKKNVTFFKKNVLIKPIMIEDITSDNNNNKNEDLSNNKKQIFNFNNYNYNYNYYNYYNYYTNKNINNQNFGNININPNNEKIIFNSLINNNNLNNLGTNSNNQEKLKLPFIFPNEYFFPYFRMPIEMNNNFIYYKNDNYNYNNIYNKSNQNGMYNQPFKNNNNSQIHNWKDKYNNLSSEERNNSSLISSTGTTAHETLINNNEENNKKIKNSLSKGRKIKNLNTNKNSNVYMESKHTKFSTDNMMRKIKNKVIESSRLLINRVLKNEFKCVKNNNFPYQEFHKIQGSFSQELNIKYNYWFYLATIKEIFCLEISNKYTAIQKSSNKELIDFLFSEINKDKFIKTKKLLETPFHKYYHDIFLDEDKDWKNLYSINEKDNKYQIEYLLKTLEEEENLEKIDPDKKYINEINYLAHNYEIFFLEKKPRNMDYTNKKNEFIKNFLTNTINNNNYLQLTEEVKKLKEFYDSRALQNKSKSPKTNISENTFPEKQEIDNEKELIKINEESLKNELNEKDDNKQKTEKKNSKKIFYIGIFPKNKEIERMKNKNKQNISLKEEEEKQNNIYESKTIKKKNILNNDIEDELPKDNNDDLNKKSFCNKKRNREKTKYFLICKKIRKISNDIKSRFCVNKCE